MADPAVQQLFESPLIEANLVDPAAGDEAVVAAVIALAERFTMDVSQPETPRFRWVPGVGEVRLRAGETTAPAVERGAFWVGLVGREGRGSVVLEDPRAALVAPGEAGLHVTVPGMAAERASIEAAVGPGAILLFPAHLRHGYSCGSDGGARWSKIVLTARRLPA